MEQEHAAAVHLDSELHHVACTDVGFTIGTAVVLPMLQVRVLYAVSCAFAAPCHDSKVLFWGRVLTATGPWEATRHRGKRCLSAVGQVPPRSASDDLLNC